MKAPDKIYIGLTHSEFSGVVYNTVSATFPNAKEYIRKDALISFLEKEKYDLYNWHFHDEDRKFKVYEEVIDKIKEL